MMFVYQDFSGNKTLRKLSRVREDDLYLHGFCEYSKGLRTFRKERIETFINEENAEAYADVSLPTIDNERRKRVKENHDLEICFSGFKAAEKKFLTQLASSKGLLIRTAWN